MSVLEKSELLNNAAGRTVPEFVNGRPQVAYRGVGRYRPIRTMVTNVNRAWKQLFAAAACVMEW